MKVAYVFSTSGHTASYKLGKMILPQLEGTTGYPNGHGAEVVGMSSSTTTTSCCVRVTRWVKGCPGSHRSRTFC